MSVGGSGGGGQGLAVFEAVAVAFRVGERPAAVDGWMAGALCTTPRQRASGSPTKKTCRTQTVYPLVIKRTVLIDSE